MRLLMQSHSSMAPQLPLIASAEAMLQIKKAAGAHLELATVANSDRCVDLAKHLGNMTNGVSTRLPLRLGCCFADILHL